MGRQSGVGRIMRSMKKGGPVGAGYCQLCSKFGPRQRVPRPVGVYGSILCRWCSDFVRQDEARRSAAGEAL